jgi:hypothetical protein
MHLVQDPPVFLTRIPRFETYEVLAQDLEALNDLVGDENQAMGFGSFSGGVAVSTITVLVTTTLSSAAIAFCTPLAAVTSLAAVWFFIKWRRVRKRRPQLLDKIHGRGQALGSPDRRETILGTR